ncbi:hypothetical protein JOD55_001517 [Arcanobacterium pluranimalium]|uniref:hypothetical protein n=1 Tax=Arcanobacterium pluranimalium TaxID=108028 RepID=UPI00195EEB93|nr:hypothetical protein [Arcanobacterium pluranimalium]MBM7825690.1 hypothetical protein [Arcanobacterium pluranimalium]
MAEEKTADDVRYQSIVFLNAVVPVLKPIIAQTPALQKAFRGKNGVVQISALTGENADDGKPGKIATHLIVEDGEVTVQLGEHVAPNVELEFASREDLNTFFTGGTKLPKMKGALSNLGLLVATIRSLLRMSKLLGATEPPEDPDEQALLVKCMFYLLTSGISQLNKAKHPLFRDWANRQPDRVYQLTVMGREDLDAYVRVKGGRSKAVRGSYTRSKPFFAMAFDSTRSALGILLDVDDMIEATVSQKIVMQGAPEYGAELGELMQTVGGYAK